jgi:hypothetical protein
MYRIIKKFAEGWLEIADSEHALVKEMDLVEELGYLNDLKEFMHYTRGSGLVSLLKDNPEAQEDKALWRKYFARRSKYLIDTQEAANARRIAIMRAGGTAAQMEHTEVAGVVEMVHMMGNLDSYLK